MAPGTREQSDDLTLDNEIDLWTRHLTAQDLNPRTRRQYAQVVRNVAKAGGWHRADDFDREGIVAYLTDLRLSGRSAKTHNNHRSIIGKFLGFRAPSVYRRCFKDDGVATARVRATRGAKRALEPLEAVHLLEVVRLEERKRPTMPTRASVYEVALLTGIRRGVLGDYYGVGDCLKASDLEFGDDPKIRIRSELDKGGRDRILPLSAAAAAVLEQQVSGHSSEDPVFWTIPTAATFLRDLERAGISSETLNGKVSFHSLRHTFNTMMVLAGIPLTDRQILMCHSATAMTDRIYRDDRMLWSRLRAAVNAVPATLNPLVFGQSSDARRKTLAGRRSGCTMSGMMPLAQRNNTLIRDTPASSTASGIKVGGSGRVSTARDQDRPEMPTENGHPDAGTEWAQQDSNLLRRALTADEDAQLRQRQLPEDPAIEREVDACGVAGDGGGQADKLDVRAGVDSGRSHKPAHPGSTPGPAIGADARRSDRRVELLPQEKVRSEGPRPPAAAGNVTAHRPGGTDPDSSTSNDQLHGSAAATPGRPAQDADDAPSIIADWLEDTARLLRRLGRRRERDRETTEVDDG